MDREHRLLDERLPPLLRIAPFILVLLYTGSFLAATLTLAPEGLGLLDKIPLARIASWTALQAAAASGIAVALGTPVGIAAGYYMSRPARAYRVLGLPVFMAPSVAVVLGFRWLTEAGLAPGWAARAPWGIILIHAYFNIPLAAVMVEASVAGLTRDLADYVEGLGLRGARLWRRLLLPAALPGAASAGLLAYIYAFTGLAAPLMVEGAAYRYYTLEAWIYTVYWGLPGLRALAAALALIQALALAILAHALITVQRRMPRAELSEAPGRARRGHPLLSAYSLALLVALYMPLASTVAGSLVDPYTGEAGLGAYERLLQGPLPLPPPASGPRSIALSITYATLTMALATLLALPLALGHRLRPLAGLTPLIVSPVVAGVAVHLTLYHPLSSTLGHLPAILTLIVMLHTVMALPLASRSLEVGITRVPREAAAYLAGLPLPPSRLLTHLLRATGPSLRAAAALAAAASLGEFGAVLVITDPSTWSLGVLAYSLYSAGRVPMLAHAAASLLLMLTLALSWVVARSLREWM